MIVDHAWRRGTDRGTACGSVDSAQWSRTVTANSGGWARARSVPGLNNCAERRFRAEDNHADCALVPMHIIRLWAHPVRQGAAAVGDRGGSENLDLVTGDTRFVDAVHAAGLRVHYTAGSSRRCWGP